jgi:YD repeat-containing protein
LQIRKGLARPANQSHRCVGAANRISADAQFSYTYDNDGNLARKVAVGSGEITDYTYDYRNRLTQVTVQSAGGVLLSTASYTLMMCLIG